ncbi:hypothetical protein [Roseovarius mucosus]|uniref:hypothetical protein n=1 Tax=Roseovarius mucosus TaxID=215743 RepID=UPI0035D10654
MHDHDFNSHQIHFWILLIVRQLMRAESILSKIDHIARNPRLALSTPARVLADEESSLVSWDVSAAVAVRFGRVQQIFLSSLDFSGSTIVWAIGKQPQLVEVATRSFTTFSSERNRSPDNGLHSVNEKITLSYCYYRIIADSASPGLLIIVVKDACQPHVNIREISSKTMAEYKEGGDVDP